jgi:hypothetical protein
MGYIKKICVEVIMPIFCVKYIKVPFLKELEGATGGVRHILGPEWDA